jgi:3-oxoacyl-[acyl-carrier-protein] synthase-3
METGQKVCIAGTGSYLPERVMTNKDLEKLVDTTDEWILTRTGISERHIAAEDETTSDMAAEACKAALSDSGVSPEDVDVIVCATMSPDRLMPSTACLTQHKIGAKNAFCFDVAAACSGFLYALKTAEGLLATNNYKTALVVGAEKMSAFIDWEDRGTCVLFGDGAGAVVLKVAEDTDEASGGLLSSVLKADGEYSELLTVPAGGAETPSSVASLNDRLHYLKMGGNTVFKHAVRCMGSAAKEAIASAGLTKEDIDCVIPHQANMRIISAIADRIDVSLDKFHNNLNKVGNTTAASVPLALDEAFKCGRVKKGDKVLFVVFGGGFTWGATVVEL